MSFLRFGSFNHLIPLALAIPGSLFADSSTTTQRTVTTLADGVYEIRHPDAPDGFPQSNTTVIIGEKSVFVVDSCLLPSTAQQDVEQISKWTSRPVTYLLNTHWHFDHTLGNATYAAAFPSVQILAHRHTRRVIAQFNPVAVANYPTREEQFRKYLETGKDRDGSVLTEGDRKDYEHALAGLAAVVAEFSKTHQLPPDVAFDRELDIDLGGRTVQVRFLGRANTGGDAVVYLPAEKILIAGDVLVHPVPYMFGGFPTDFPSALDRLEQFDAQTIVPGHGEILRNKDYIRKVRSMIQAVNDFMTDQVDHGKTFDETKEAVAKWNQVKAWRQQFAGTDMDSLSTFDQSFNSLVKAAYDQARMR